MTLSLPTPRPSSLPALTDAQPTEAETAVWNQVSAVLEEAHGILAELQSYNGAGQEIREVSMNQSSPHCSMGKLALMPGLEFCRAAGTESKSKQKHQKHFMQYVVSINIISYKAGTLVLMITWHTINCLQKH